MVAFYVRRINLGLMTLEEVPKLWKESVANKLKEA